MLVVISKVIFRVIYVTGRCLPALRVMTAIGHVVQRLHKAPCSEAIIRTNGKIAVQDEHVDVASQMFRQDCLQMTALSLNR